MPFIYDEVNQKKSFLKKAFRIFFLLIFVNAIITNFLIRIYHIQDSLIEGIEERSFVLTHFYPFWSSPQKEDIVFVQDFATSFWSLGKWVEIFTLGVFKQNSWGMNSFNKTRAYKVIAQEGDRISLEGNLIKVINYKGEESIYVLPLGANQFFSFLILEGYTLEGKEFLGFLDKGTDKEYIHLLRFFSRDLVKGKKWFNFNF